MSGHSAICMVVLILLYQHYQRPQPAHRAQASRSRGHEACTSRAHVRAEGMYEHSSTATTPSTTTPPRAHTHPLYIYIYIYINVCIYFYIHTIDIYIHIHTYTYIYIYTDRQTHDIYISSGRRAYGGRRPSVGRHMLLASPAKRRRPYAASRRPAYAVRGYSVRSSICC